MAAKVLVVLFVALALTWESGSAMYYGKLIGTLKETKGDAEGTVYCVNETAVCITGLKYDGSGPAVTFWAGTSADSKPDEQGDKVPYEGSTDKLPELSYNALVLILPKAITSYNYFGLWCSQAKTTFGYVEIQPGFMPPGPQNLTLPTTQDPSVKVTGAALTDSKTIFLENFEYTPAADADAAFAVGETNSTPTDKLVKISGKLQAIHQPRYEVMLNGSDWTRFSMFHLYDFGQSPKSLLSIPIPKDKAQAVPPNPAPVSSKQVAISTVASTAAATDAATAAGGQDTDTTAAGKVKGQDKDTTTAGGGEDKENDHEETTTKAPGEESGGLGLIVILGIVGIVVCIGVGLAFFFFFAPGGEETAPGPAPPAGGTAAATGDGTAGTQGGDK